LEARPNALNPGKLEGKIGGPREPRETIARPRIDGLRPSGEKGENTGKEMQKGLLKNARSGTTVPSRGGCRKKGPRSGKRTVHVGNGPGPVRR